MKGTIGKIYKRKIFEVSNDIGDCRRDGCWSLGDDKHELRYSVYFRQELNGKNCPNYRYFKTEDEAIKFRDCIMAQVIK